MSKNDRPPATPNPNMTTGSANENFQLNTTRRQGTRKAGALAGSGSAFQEAAMGLFCGVLYGATSPVIGHPFDCVKTRMQAEASFRDKSVMDTVRIIYRTQGLGGFYRGFVPPLVGSMAFRGILFSAYSGTYAACEKGHFSILAQPIPYTGGLKPSVVLGALAASLARATIESPFDYMKVRFMVGEAALQDTKMAGTWKDGVRSLVAAPVASVRQLYKGFGATVLRTMGLLGSFFVLVDYSVRYIPEVVNAPLLGPFFKGGVCATTAWTICFPLETAKSIIQADLTGKYNQKASVTKVLYELYQERGIIRGWYRGFGPGASRSFVANGASMIVYSWLQDHIRKS